MIILSKILINGKYFINRDYLIEINNLSEESQHTHDFIEFVYMLKGKSVHSLDNHEYFLKSGDLLIINYGQTHRFNGEHNARFCNILIKPKLIDKSLNECNDLWEIFDTPRYNQFKQLLNSKRACCKTPKCHPDPREGSPKPGSVLRRRGILRPQNDSGFLFCNRPFLCQSSVFFTRFLPLRRRNG